MSRDGWVTPPPWRVVRRSVDTILTGLGRHAEEGVVVLGTGGWSFAVQALTDLFPRRAVRALDSLDPWILRHQAAAGAYLAVSASGSTVETQRLAAVFAGSPLVWLRDRAAPPAAYALSPSGRADQVAMLGAPLSTAFLVPAALADPVGLAAAYGRLEAGFRRLTADAVGRAGGVGTEQVRIAPPGWAGDGLRLWLLQLGRQVLGGKSGTSGPWVDVTSEGPPSLDLTGARADLAGLMELMFVAGTFTAALAVRAGVAPTEHANVTAYKRLLDDPPRPSPVDTADLVGLAADWLRGRPDLLRLHVVRYGGAPAPLPDAAALATATGRCTEVHAGTAWNHHSFQAVYASPETAVLVLLPQPEPLPDGPVGAAADTLLRVALATHACLPGRSLLVREVG